MLTVRHDRHPVHQLVAPSLRLRSRAQGSDVVGVLGRDHGGVGGAWERRVRRAAGAAGGGCGGCGGRRVRRAAGAAGGRCGGGGGGGRKGDGGRRRRAGSLDPRPREVHGVVADVVPVPAHPARGPGGRGGPEPPAAGPGRLHPPRRARHLLLAAAGLPGAAQRRARRPRGDGRDRRAGGALPGAAAARALRGDRPLDRVRRQPLPAPGPQGQRLPARPHPRGDVHAAREGPVLVLQGPAAVDLPDPDQVPRRGPPPRRASCAAASSS